MSDNSAIEWTDATWTPVRGCVKVSPGCAHCYAETFAERFRGVPGHPYEQGFDLRLVPAKLTEPLSWKKPRRVFVNSMSDLFQDGVDLDFIVRVFAVMQQAHKHTFQVLTKRAARMLDIVGHPSFHSNVSGCAGIAPIPWPLPNVWLGVSVENQHFADARKQPMQQLADLGWLTWVSYEPALERVDFWDWLPREVETGQTTSAYVKGIRWLVVGGESGPAARPFHVEWARAVIAQCREAGVPCFVKQLGAHPIFPDGGGSEWPQHDRKGGDVDEWPHDVRVREFPTTEHDVKDPPTPMPQGDGDDGDDEIGDGL